MSDGVLRGGKDGPAVDVTGQPGEENKVQGRHPHDQVLRSVYPDTRLCYRYEGAKQAALDRGQVWLEAWVPQTDADFAAAGLTQDQADAMLAMYGRNVAHLFNPKIWNWRQRIALACLFLFGTK